LPKRARPIGGAPRRVRRYRAAACRKAQGQRKHARGRIIPGPTKMEHTAKQENLAGHFVPSSVAAPVSGGVAGERTIPPALARVRERSSPQPTQVAAIKNWGSRREEAAAIAALSLLGLSPSLTQQAATRPRSLKRPPPGLPPPIPASGIDPDNQTSSPMGLRPPPPRSPTRPITAWRMDVYSPPPPPRTSKAAPSCCGRDDGGCDRGSVATSRSRSHSYNESSQFSTRSGSPSDAESAAQLSQPPMVAAVLSFEVVTQHPQHPTSLTLPTGSNATLPRLGDWPRAAWRNVRRAFESAHRKSVRSRKGARTTGGGASRRDRTCERDLSV